MAHRDGQRPGFRQSVRYNDNLQPMLPLALFPVQTPKIDRYLASDDILRPIVARARQIDALARLCAEFLPPGLVRHVRAANLRDGDLVLLASNPPAAAKLKIIAESLRKFLLQQGSKVSSVSVRVQPTSAHSVPPPQGKAAALSTKGIAELSVLYERLAVDSPARRALGRLLNHQGVRPPPASAPRKAARAPARRGKGRT